MTIKSTLTSATGFQDTLDTVNQALVDIAALKSGASSPGPAANAAAFTMTQLAPANRVYQRVTTSGGAAGRGAGVIPVAINASATGTLFYRIRSAADGSTIRSATLPAITSTGAQTIQVPVDARQGWLYVDLSGDGQTWQLGTVPVGMGRLLYVSGQSLAVRLFKPGQNAAGVTMASLGITPSQTLGAAVAGYQDGDSNIQNHGPDTNWTIPSDTDAYSSAFIGDFIGREAARAGVQVGVGGYSVGGTSIQYFVPGGYVNGAVVSAAADMGGAWEAEYWLQGHSDSQAGMAGATYKGYLDQMFACLAANNTYTGTVEKYLSAIPVGTAVGAWGSQDQINVICQASAEWASAHGGTYLTLGGLATYDGVHETQAGAQVISQQLSAAMGGTVATTLGVNTFSAVLGTVGTPLTITIDGPLPAETETVTGLPPGLALDNAGRHITGTPTTAGSYNVVLTETDAAAGNSGKQVTIGVTINAAQAANKVGPDLTLTSDAAFAAGTPGFGQALTKGSGSAAGTGAHGFPLTLEVQGVFGVGGMLACDNNFFLIVDAAGKASGYGYPGGGVPLPTYPDSEGTNNGPNIVDGKKHHIRLIVDANTNVYLFVDGAMTNGVAVGGGVNFVTANTFKVRDFAGPDNMAQNNDSSLDFVAVWNTAKMDGSVPTAPYTGTETGLVDLWQLDGDGTAATHS